MDQNRQQMMKHSPHSQKCKRQRRRRRSEWLRCETLELRLALDAASALPVIDTNLTISFAPDGTDVAGEASSLAERFDAVASHDEWQTAIVRAFQTWASQTSANIGVTSDQGQPFGVAGNTANDTRFGDVRIAARPLDPGVAAISVSLTSIAFGSWLGDVVFNSEFDFQTVDDIFAVTLHEAGNVFGLADNTDPDSPLFSGGIPTARWPTNDDIAALQELHGQRPVDFHEMGNDGESGTNDSFDDATHLEFPEYNNVDGAAPVIVYGDLQNSADQDIYRLQVPSDYLGSLTIELRTANLSALTPKLAVYNESFKLINETESTSPLHEPKLSIRVDQVQSDDEFYLSISSDSADVFEIGAYSLVAILDDINELDDTLINTLTDGRYARLHPEELVKLYASDDDFIAEDEHADDDTDSATELSSDESFESGTRYQVYGSISNGSDQDVYKVKTPKSNVQSTMLVSVDSLDAGQLVPRITVQDQDENEVAAEIVRHGGGTVTVQVKGIRSDDEYFVTVGAEGGWLFQTGNYDLSIDFVVNAITLDEMAEGRLDATHNLNEHTFHVARPQIFHFVFEVASVETSSKTALRLQVLDADQHVIYDLAALTGEARSAESVLLLPGSYTVAVDAVTENNRPPSAVIDYILRGTPVSDPLAIDLDTGIDAPFDCPAPNNDGAFCYPNGTMTTNPFSWDSLIDQLFRSDQLQNGELSSLLYGDWWSWYWNADGTGNAPTGVADTYQLNANAMFVAEGNDGLLHNDSDPEGQTVLAVVDSTPLHGTLQFFANGSFTYVAMPGFQGTDQFTYRAFDLGQFSDPVTVSLDVFAAGDFDFNGSIDANDIDAITTAIFDHSDSSRFDLNGDSMVDDQDSLYIVTELLATSPGDANLDGQVDAIDLEIWRNHEFSMAVGWAEGDFNFDRVTDVSDFNIWSVHRFLENRAASAERTTARRPQAALVAATVPKYGDFPEILDRKSQTFRTVSNAVARIRLPIVRSLYRSVRPPWVAREYSDTIERRSRSEQEQNHATTNEKTCSLPKRRSGDLAADNIDCMHDVDFVAGKTRDRN